MVLQFRCLSCSLTFSIGWYHHHFDYEYAGSNLCVCRMCGAQHRIVLPVRDRGPAQFDLFDVSIMKIHENARTRVMAHLRPTFSMSLAEARASCDALPFKVGVGVRQGQVEELRREFGDAEASVEVRRIGGEENPAFGPVQDYRLFLISGARGEPTSVEVRRWSVGTEVPLAELSCGECGTVGALVLDEDALPPACPRLFGHIEPGRRLRDVVGVTALRCDLELDHRS
jgi:hypothetical protein